MRSFFTKQVSGVIILFILLFMGVFLLYISLDTNKNLPLNDSTNVSPKQVTIGMSVENREIKAYTFGVGEKCILFVGGMHGGYEWNSVLLSYEFIEYFKIHPEIIPKNLSITIIPSINPDGIFKVAQKEGFFTSADIPEDISQTISGRFNANEVDLNRNFDCKWKPRSIWREKPVDAGKNAFSEPETQALRDFVLENNPIAVIFWHSQANAVYASECENGVLPETLDIMNTYSKASSYKAIDSFDAYEVTGDAEGWLASINIPAITVELKTHKSIEWEQNLAGVKALLDYYNTSI